ncbi:MAG TPA: carbon monoxide dehydrogenase subunit G [Gemmatimonadales bacterium]|nr:carbon monoxide dehydrogenase subunit G [Gemmatimonadales bacterium]
MIVEGTFTFPGPRETVWRLLLDPDVLVKTLPGAKRLERTGTDRYEGVMQLGVGPVTAAEFAVAVTLAEQVPPERYAMQLNGAGALGFARGTAHISLAPAPSGGTRMQYRAELHIGGKIASVGQRLLDAAAKLLTRQGLEALNRELSARLAGPPP